MPTGYHKTSISLEPGLAARADARAKRLGFENSFSAYVQRLIREDLEHEQATAAKLSEVHTPVKPQPERPVSYRKPTRAAARSGNAGAKDTPRKPKQFGQG